MERPLRARIFGSVGEIGRLAGRRRGPDKDGRRLIGEERFPAVGGWIARFLRGRWPQFLQAGGKAAELRLIVAAAFIAAVSREKHIATWSLGIAMAVIAATMATTISSSNSAPLTPRVFLSYMLR